MYAPISLNDFAQDSQHSARVVIGLKNMFVGIKHFLGNFAAYTIAYIALVPVIILFKYLRYRIQKTIPKTIKIDEKNYSGIRDTFDKSTAIVKVLQPLYNINMRNIPWVIRIILRQIQKLVQTLEVANDRMLFALTKLDNVPSNDSPKYFEQIKEQELWNQRPKNYQYRV